MAFSNPTPLPSPMAGDAANSAPAIPHERRQRARSRVHWPVLLTRHQQSENTIETVTQDLSSGGFYCLSSQPFEPGERLSCKLRMAVEFSGGRESRLECSVMVVRVENRADGAFGIACRTIDYRLSTH